MKGESNHIEWNESYHSMVNFLLSRAKKCILASAWFLQAVLQLQRSKAIITVDSLAKVGKKISWARSSTWLYDKWVLCRPWSYRRRAITYNSNCDQIAVYQHLPVSRGSTIAPSRKPETRDDSSRVHSDSSVSFAHFLACFCASRAKAARVITTKMRFVDIDAASAHIVMIAR